MIIVSACISCKHLVEDSLNGRPWKCAAFPTGVPQLIEIGEARHLKPFPGDHGIQWEPLDETATNVE